MFCDEKNKGYQSSANFYNRTRYEPLPEPGNSIEQQNRESSYIVTQEDQGRNEPNCFDEEIYTNNYHASYPQHRRTYASNQRYNNGESQYGCGGENLNALQSTIEQQNRYHPPHHATSYGTSVDHRPRNNYYTDIDTNNYAIDHNNATLSSVNEGCEEEQGIIASFDCFNEHVNEDVNQSMGEQFNEDVNTNKTICEVKDNKQMQNTILNNDPNPIVITKKMKEPAKTYNQSIWVRYLQPPEPPVPGPIIIREIRDKPIPLQPPIIIRQRPPNPKTPPPLILREKPPLPPCVPKEQLLIKRIPSAPPPPRQVIIERYPPLPPKPRDIIIEKWLPYKEPEKRKVIVHRAPPEKIPDKPRNMIIRYVRDEPMICKTLKQMCVDTVNPDMYKQLYGHELMHPSCLKRIAYKEGVLNALEPCNGAINIQCGTCCPPQYTQNPCCNTQCQPLARQRSCSANIPSVQAMNSSHHGRYC